MASSMARYVSFGVAIAAAPAVFSAAAQAQVHAPPPALARAPAAPGDAADDDVPPPTAYDRLMAQTPMGVQPETRGLMHLAGRLLAGLVAVVALIYASLRFVLPRYFKKWSTNTGRELRVIERLSLDNRNAVVLVQMRSGAQLLLGTGEHGVQFLTRVEPLAGPATDFRDTLAAGAVVGHRPREDGHAAEH